MVRKMENKNNYINKIAKSNHNIKFFWKRTGSCDYVKCQSACCRFNVHKSIENNGWNKDYHKMNEYSEMTVSNVQIRKLNKHDIVMSPRLCPHIKIEGGCNLHGKRTQPHVCKYFPMTPIDGVYIAVKHVCGYKFKEIRNPNYK